MKKNVVITIDGPVGSGKSSVAKLLAKNLDFYYLYTGLLYRAAAYVLSVRTDLLPQPSSVCEFDVARLTPKDLTCLDDISYSYVDKKPVIAYKNEDITPALMKSGIDQAASCVSANQLVRFALIDAQRNIAQTYNVVADGRDCGSVVFPDASVKFYLTAAIDVRAQRLFNDATRSCGSVSLDDVKKSIIERDKRDQSRKVAPLVVPEGAIVIDNSDMTLEQTAQAMEGQIKKILNKM